MDLRFAVMAVKVGVPRRWWTLSVACVVLLVLNTVQTVRGQGMVAQNGSVHFLDNYESQSDAQHFRMLNNGAQVQLVLDEYAGTYMAGNAPRFVQTLFILNQCV